ncbi:MAG: DUF1385 domain-containing protein [Coriobacteriales bacterium]|jgi:uncharacterized protein YqhQ|nr:DUF1385 domain-containing protein [Coriobacteriales bacterium]
MSDQANAPASAPSSEQALERHVAEPSDMARAVDETGVVCRTHVGGQALIEGIMMRGKYNWAVAVRQPDATMHLEEHDLLSGRDKNSWMYKPVVRGCTALVESLGLGYKALEIAARYAFDLDEEEEEEEKNNDGEASSAASLNDEEAMETAPAAVGEDEAPKPVAACSKEAEQEDKDAPQAAPEQSAGASGDDEPSDNGIPKPLLTVSMLVGIILGVGVFIVLPAVITNLIVGDYGERTLLWNIVDGLLRVAIFIFYIWLIGRMRDVKRMFAYHGAEHKTIHCYEHGLELNVRNAQGFPTLHVRCGTAFMLMTMIIAILVFTIVPIQWLITLAGIENEVLRLVVVILARVILLPLVAGLSYEVTVKWAGSRPNNPLVRVILWPGLQMQRLTTNEPDDGMIECAIAAMQCVLKREEREAAAALDGVGRAGTQGAAGVAEAQAPAEQQDAA